MPLLHISFQSFAYLLNSLPPKSTPLSCAPSPPPGKLQHHRFPFPAIFLCFLCSFLRFFAVFPEHKINTKTLQSHSASERALRLPTSAFHLHSTRSPFSSICLTSPLPALLHVSVIIIILLLLSFCAFHFAVYAPNYATLIEVNFFYFAAASGNFCCCCHVSDSSSPSPFPLQLQFSLKIILQLISTSGNYEFSEVSASPIQVFVACLRELAAFLIELPSQLRPG